MALGNAIHIGAGPRLVAIWLGLLHSAGTPSFLIGS